VIDFPERQFVAKDEQTWHSELLRGAETASSLSVAILALMRDLERQVGHACSAMEAIGRMFSDYLLCVFENDSCDATPAQLHQWAAADPQRRRAESAKLGWEKWGPVADGRRGEQMACYRNRCRTMALATGPRDLYIVLDADLYGWSLEGIQHSLSHWGQFDVMASNGLVYWGTVLQYDSWTWREDNWDPVPMSYVHQRVYRRGDPLLPVLSAFGGMALYRATAFEAAEYGGGDCEHVVFHRRLREAGYGRVYVNPSQITLYNPVPSW
jgi:hypothetical protein